MVRWVWFKVTLLSKQRHYFANKSLYSQSYGSSSSHAWMWELDHNESWAPKNWCFWIVVLEKTLESPLDCKEIQPVHPKGNQPWIFIGRTDTEAETPILWPPDAKNWLIWKDPNAGKDQRWEEKGTTEDEMVGWAQWTWVWVNSRSWRWTERLAAVHGFEKSWIWLSNWTDSFIHLFTIAWTFLHHIFPKDILGNREVNIQWKPGQMLRCYLS